MSDQGSITVSEFVAAVTGAMTPENVDGALASFADELWGEYNDAVANHDYHKANHLKQLAARFSDSALQDTLRSSWNNLSASLQDAVGTSANKIANLQTLQEVATKMGKSSSMLSGAMTGLDVGEALANGDHAAAARALGAGLLAGAIGAAAVLAGATLGSAVAIGVLGTIAAKYVMTLLPEEWAEKIGEWMDDFLSPLYNGLSDFLEWWDPLGIMPDVNLGFNGALNWVPRRDPLTLDLDGDGVETLPADGQVLFDHDGDGVKQGTGWVAPDDGMLVLDRNANGTIDNGGELFGDNTIKNDGSTALNGFDALSDLDSNGDGRIDSNDDQFADLRIWRDLNSDGISQANELKTLGETGVAAINLDSEASTMDVGSGNVANAVGTFEWSDNTVGSVLSSAASLDLASNPFYREFTNTIEVPEELLDLPTMTGSGAVRDLLEAAALSPGLANTLRQYSEAQSKQEQMSLIDTLIEDWSNSADFDDFVERLNELKTGATDFLGNYDPEAGRDIKFFVDYDDYYYGADELDVGRFPDDETIETLAKIRVLEIFNGTEFFDFDFSSDQDDSTTEEDDVNVDITLKSGRNSSSFSRTSSGGSGAADLFVSITNEDFTFSSNQIDLISNAYDALKESIYQALLFQTRLKPYTDAVTLKPSQNGGVQLDFDGLNLLIEQNVSADKVAGVTDLVELMKYRGSSYMRFGWTVDTSQIKDSLSTLTTEEIAQLSENGIEYITDGSGTTGDSTTTSFTVDGDAGTSIVGGDGVDLLFGAGGDDQIHGAANVDYLFGEGGSDSLNGESGNDFLDGGTGDDALYGGDGNDALWGGTGGDALYGGYGNDDLSGGAGDDYLSGDDGNDTYRFGYGDGNDAVYDYTRYETDRVVFGEGITVDKLSRVRDGNDLVLQLSDSATDSLRIKSWFASSDTTRYTLDEYEFADGTVLSRSEFLAAVEYPHTSGDDTIQGGYESDVLNGGDGNDTLRGEDNSDTLLGDGGDDALYGGYGNDDLSGGAGDDYLSGDDGNDTYRFGYGDGHDVVRDYSRYETDQVVFDDGLTMEDLWFSQVGNDLQITLVGTDDKLIIDDWYNGTYYRIDEFHAGDLQLHRDQVDQLVNAMASFDVPEGVGAVVPEDVQQQLEPTLTATWQPAA